MNGYRESTKVVEPTFSSGITLGQKVAKLGVSYKQLSKRSKKALEEAAKKANAVSMLKTYSDSKAVVEVVKRDAVKLAAALSKLAGIEMVTLFSLPFAEGDNSPMSIASRKIQHLGTYFF